MVGSAAAVPGGLGAERSGARERSGPRKGRILAEETPPPTAPKNSAGAGLGACVMALYHYAKKYQRFAPEPVNL